MNILLADDSVPAQNMGKKILVDAGYAVVTVNNGLEALRKIAEAVPDIAILDIFMPGYTGLEICKRLRSSAATASIPVILTVGKLEPYRPEDGEEVQSNAVIVKPFAATELISAVRSLIGGPLAEAVAPPPHAMAGDPLQEGPLASRAGAPTATAGTFLDEPDEPLFANAVAEAGVDTLPSAASAYGSEHPLFGADSSGPSLAFDPDARPTPFSASAIEASASHSLADSGASAFTEFDLAPEPRHAASEPGMVAIDEPLLTAPSPYEFTQEFTQQAAQEGLVAAAEPTVTMPESPAAPEAIASASLASAELESSALEIPAFDPLLELSEPPAVLESSILEVGEAPEQIIAEFAPLDADAPEVFPTSSAASSAAQPPPEELSLEEEARRAAFEALFNSPEALPLDTIPAPPTATAPVALPEVAESPKDHTYEIEPEYEIPQPEIKALADDRQQHLAAPGLDPNLVPNSFEEVQPASQPLSAIHTTPDLLDAPPLPDLLDDALVPTERPGTGSQWKPEEASASIATDSPRFDETVGLAPALSPEAASVPEAVLAEAHPETPGAYEPTPPAEIIPAAPGVAADAPRTGPEVVPSLAVPPEAKQIETRQSAPGPGHSEAEMPLVAAAPAYLEAPPVRVEAVPVPVSAPAEAEPPEPNQLQPEPPMGEIFSPPGVLSRLNEAERIHRAIETVFDRFKPLLVAAIVRELARHD